LAPSSASRSSRYWLSNSRRRSADVGERRQGFLGGRAVGHAAFGLDDGVLRQVGPAHHRRQRQSLQHQGRDDAGGDEHDDVAVRQRQAVVQGVRDG
jgi:hypothetical protein